MKLPLILSNGRPVINELPFGFNYKFQWDVEPDITPSGLVRFNWSFRVEFEHIGEIIIENTCSMNAEQFKLDKLSDSKMFLHVKDTVNSKLLDLWNKTVFASFNALKNIDSELDSIDDTLNDISINGFLAENRNKLEKSISKLNDSMIDSAVNGYYRR